MRPMYVIGYATGSNPANRHEHPYIARDGIEKFTEDALYKARRLGMEVMLHMPCLRDPGDYLSDSFWDVPVLWREYFRSTRFERAIRDVPGYLNVYLPFFNDSRRTMPTRERFAWLWRTFAPWERLYGQVRIWGDMAVQDPDGMAIVDAELGGRMGAEALPCTKGADGRYTLGTLEPRRPYLCFYKFLTGGPGQEPRDPDLTWKVNPYCHVIMEFNDSPTIEQARRLSANGWTVGCHAGAEHLWDDAGVWRGDA